MTKEKTIDYCYDNRDEYIKSFDSINEGIRAFDCLIAILEDDTISPDEIKDYGMDF